MKALTLTQPFATLIAIGAKKIETRSWRTDYRGPVAIHAAKGLSKMSEDEFVALCHSTPFLEHLAKAGYTASSLPRGAILCITSIDKCVSTCGMYPRPVSPERDFGDYGPGRYAWYLGPVTVLPKPIPAKGALSLWDWKETA